MNITLREWKISDAPVLAAILNNENILNALRDGIPYPYTCRDAENYIKYILNADKSSVFEYAIVADGKVVGNIGGARQSNIHSRSAEIGYYLSEEYWGKGIMTEAVKKLCHTVFETTDIVRIYAEPFSYNTGSRKVLENAGFTFEGILKNNAVKNGRLQDMAMYSLVREQEKYPVRRLTGDEIPAALDIVINVYMEYLAPAYPPEGTDFFKANFTDPDTVKKLNFYGAFDGDKLVGTLATRKPQHISEFFVLGEYQHKGIGRALFNAMRRDYHKQVFTVNASPYAYDIYEHFGFKPVDIERCENGLIFTSMKYEKEEDK